MPRWSRRQWSRALALGGASLSLLPQSAQACGNAWVVRDALLGPAGLKGGCLQLYTDEQHTRFRGPRANIYKLSGPARRRYLFEGDGWSAKASERVFELRDDALWQGEQRIGALAGHVLRLEAGGQTLAFELKIPPVQGERELQVVHQGRSITTIAASEWCDMEPESVRSALALFCAWRTLRWHELAPTLAL